MTRLRPIALLVALVSLGAAGAIAVAAVLGMKGSEVARLAALMGPAIVVTVAAALLASWLLRRTSMRQRYLAVAAVGTLVALANLVVLTQAMFVSAHAATVLAVVLTYASGAGLAAAFVVGRSSASALSRITSTASALGEGDLSARVGRIDAGPELDRLAGTLDGMSARLEDLRGREQEIEQTRRDLITAVSHDLRTPLGNLRAMAEAIDDGVVTDPPTLRRYVGEMGRAVEQLSALVDDLFELVQVDGLQLGAEPERARLADVVASASATVQGEAGRKGVVLRWDLDGIDGASCSPYLERVLQNLLINAVQHTPPGGVVRIVSSNVDGELRLVVEDTGTGISDRDLPFVFEPFYRGDVARSSEGTGLGLALAERIVHALGGSIEVESEFAVGTRFSVTLPRRGSASPPPEGPASPNTRSDVRRGSGSRLPS
jgi:signal transduction histidine kinase